MLSWSPTILGFDYLIGMDCHVVSRCEAPRRESGDEVPQAEAILLNAH